MKQLKCPSCGAGLQLNSPYEIVVECPYCHSQVINESAYQSKNNSVEPNVLPFHLTEEKMMGVFTNHLIGLQDTPADVFAKMQILSVKKFYVPMYIFQGTFRAPWTAKVPHYEERQKFKNGELKNEQIVVYDYVNGEAVGNFSFKSVPEDEANKIGLDLNFLQNVDVNPSRLTSLVSANIVKDDKVEILQPSGNADIVWSQYAEQMALNEAYAAAQAQCPKSGSFIYKSKIISCSASCEMRKATLIFIPIWRIDYKYQENKYHFISYAEQDEKWTAAYPKETGSIQANATGEQQALLDEYNKEVAPANNFMGWGCGILLVAEILTIFGITSFFESLKEANFGWYFPVAGLVVLIIWFVIDEKKKKKFGVDDINADIANRTEKMVQASLDYKKQTSLRFMQDKAWENDTPLNASDLTSTFLSSFASLQTPDEANQPTPQVSPLYESDTSNNNTSNTGTKYCKQCGKEIDASHTFCKFCGTKQ